MDVSSVSTNPADLSPRRKVSLLGDKPRHINLVHSWLAALSALGSVCLVACAQEGEAPVAHAAPQEVGKAPPATSHGASRSASTELAWDLGTTPLGPGYAVVMIPPTRPGDKWPLVIALHGRGEAKKSPREGALGWAVDYKLRRAMQRLAEPPLTRADFEDFITPERLERINRSLLSRPYRGLIIACPYLPDRLKGEEAFAEAPALAHYLLDQVLERVRKETPAAADAAATAIAGVSLGGRGALLAAWQRPLRVNHVGGWQPALDTEELSQFTALASTALKQNPALQVRLITSEEDYFLSVTRDFHAALRSAAVPVTMEILVGDHSYRFNRGPGAIELLLYYDRVLRGEPYLR